MQKEELSNQEVMLLNKVVLSTTLALFILAILNFVAAELLKFKFIPFPDGIIIICGLILTIRSVWLCKLDITRKYHSKIKTTLLFMAFVISISLTVAIYAKNPSQIMDNQSLNRNFTILIGACLLICGMWVESFIGTRALKRDMEAK